MEYVILGLKVYELPTDRRTDRQTERQTDGPTRCCV